MSRCSILVLPLLLVILCSAHARAAWEEFELDCVEAGGMTGIPEIVAHDGEFTIIWPVVADLGEVVSFLDSPAVLKYARGNGPFTEPLVLDDGSGYFHGWMPLVYRDELKLVALREGPQEYGFYLQDLSPEPELLQYIAPGGPTSFYADVAATGTSVWLADCERLPGDELRSLSVYGYRPESELTGLTGPRSAWPAITVFGGEVFVAYHNMLNYGDDLGPTFGRFELARVGETGIELAYADETRKHNGTYPCLVADEQNGVLWASYANPTRYVYPPQAPESAQSELRLHEIVLVRWDGEQAVHYSVTIGPGQFFHDLALVGGVPHVYYLDRPHMTIYEASLRQGAVQLDTVRSFRRGGWAPDGKPQAAVTAGGAAALAISLYDPAGGRSCVAALVNKSDGG